MPRHTSPLRSLVLGLTMTLMAGLSAGISGAPASAGLDGPPELGSPLPNSSRTVGGTASRVYGHGFEGTTSVTIGGVAVPDFKVVSSELLTLTTPPGAANTFRDLVITDDDGSTASEDNVNRMYYTDAVYSVTPDTGLSPGSTVFPTITGYRPNTPSNVAEVSPLANFNETGPRFGPPQFLGPPPYVDPLLPFPTTDASGNWPNAAEPNNAITLSNPFDTDGTFHYDTQSVCPPTQDQANFGLSQCALAFVVLAQGIVEKYVSFAGNPVPAAPTLGLSTGSAPVGGTVNLSGGFWNANPWFGSGTIQDDPGESRLVIEICNASLTTCTTPVSQGTVEMTRYFDSDTDDDNDGTEGEIGEKMQGIFAGANLSGSLTVSNTSGCAPNCRVRVRQERWDFEYHVNGNSNPTGLFIEATANLTVPLPKAEVADFDGNGTTDFSVWRPSNGTWYVRNGASAVWGTSGDVAVPGDYDGNGTTDFAVFRPSTGIWYVRNGAAAQFGTSGDIAVPGDYDGNGTADFAVYRPSTGTWYVRNGAAAQFGTSGDIPVPGDYDGNGTADFAVYRPSTGTWYVRNGASAIWGTSGDIPVPGDYDGNGTTDFAVFRPSTGIWYVRNGAAAQFGTSGDVPVPGDYDGNGTTDFAVFRPSSGIWFVRNGAAAQFGTSGDIALPLPDAIRMFFF